MPLIARRTGVATNRPRPGQWTPKLFALLWLFVIAVSSFDGYLVYRHRHQIMMFEKNPVGRALITLNDGQVWYLLSAKFAGTVLACAAILFIFRRSPQLGFVIVTAVAGLQFCLLCYLTLT